VPTNFQQKLRFRNIPEERIDEFNFVGGLVTDVHETKLQQNQSSDMANVVFSDTQSIKTRNGYIRYNGSPVGAASDVSETGASTGSLAISATTDYVAQTFIPTGAISCVQIDVYLEMNTTGEEQYVRAELWSTSGGAPSAVLTNGVGQVKLITSDAETAISFRFKEPVSLSAATTYAVVIKPFVRGTTQTVNQVNVHHRGAVYADGNVYTSTDTGTNWTSDTAKDLKFNIYSGGDTANTGLIKFYSTTGIAQSIFKFGTALYRGNDGTGALTTLTMPSGVTFNSAAFLDYVVSNDTLLVIDRNNYIKKYRGSTNSNYTTGTLTTTNGSSTITGSGTTWGTSTNAETGEYIKLPDGKWYKIVSIASDTSLTIETTYQGGTLAGQTYVISPWGEIQGKINSALSPASLVRPQPDFIENHLNRIWTLEGNTLRFSVLDTSVTGEHFNDFDTSNNAGTIIIPSSKGDTGAGLYSLNGALYVFQRRAIWRIYGSSPANFELRNVTNEVGIIDRRTLVEWGDLLVFLSDRGIYLFDGSNLRNVSEDKINTSIATWANKTSCVATLWNNYYLLAYPSTGSSYNDEAIFFDLQNQVFGKIENVYASTFVAWNGGTDSGQIYFGSSNQGTIYRWDTGGNDDGYEIATRYQTPSLSFTAGMNDKAIKKFYIQQLSMGDYNMTVTQLTNISETETTGSNINLSPGSSSLWGVAQWGVDEWSSEGSMITTRVAEFQGLAKYFKFRIDQEGYDEGIEVLGINLTARMRRLQ
jgi:hypothetical protein